MSEGNKIKPLNNRKITCICIYQTNDPFHKRVKFYNQHNNDVHFK